jgi:glycosyltransferase involved in cell wall biosynthesis
MKVLFITRATLYSTPGGDTKQIDLTAAYLRQLGVEVDIKLTSETIDYSSYDLLHFFNIIRPADIMYHIDQAGKPYVVSTIFLDYGEFEKKSRGGLMGIMNKVLSEDQIEYVKAIARSIVNGEKIMSRKYLRWGHRKSIRYVAQHAGMLLPNSHNEYNRLAAKYNLQRPYRFIPNGIDAALAQRTTRKNEKYDQAVLCVARVEGRKNQLNLIRAMNNTPYKVFIHGKPSPNTTAYYEQCKAEAAANIQFTTWLSEEELYEMFHSAKVHILPSYFETTGLSSLEAAVMGCNIVVTDKGDTVEYFKDNAWFCNPDDTASIRQAIEAAHAAPYNEAFRTKILQEYTWQKAAEETLKAYQTVLQQQ